MLTTMFVHPLPQLYHAPRLGLRVSTNERPKPMSSTTEPVVEPSSEPPAAVRDAQAAEDADNGGPSSDTRSDEGQADTPTYTIRLKGEKHSFPIECWTSITLDQAASVLSDVTGYRADVVAQWITDGMEDNPPKVVTSSAAATFTVQQD